jgi:alkaline phosphatase D
LIGSQLERLNLVKQMKKILLALTLCLVGVSYSFAQNQRTRIVKITRTTSGKTSQTLQNYFDQGLAPFYHGVASGDPLSDRVILWTRVTPDTHGNVEVIWQVATDPKMQNVVNSGVVVTNDEKDYTVKVDADGLQPATTYYYHFSALGKNSLVGRTRTAPTTNVENLRFAVVSCSNYQNGYFNAYGNIAERNDIDAVIHLGDYIYEYATGEFGYSDEIGRGHQPSTEIFTLEDYRIRYSYYRLDPQLRRLHQQLPFITVWDDHEFANDAYKDGAENHQSNEGSWGKRKGNAFKAYFEWMPVRTNDLVKNRIYRKISYGNLVDLIMLDTRIEGREAQAGGGLFRKSTAKKLEARARQLSRSRTSEGDKLTILLKEFLPYMVNVNTGNQRAANALTTEEFDFAIKTLVKWVEARKQSKDVKAQPDFLKLRNLLLKAQKDNPEQQARTKAQRSMLGADQLAWFKSQLSNSSAKWKLIGNQVMFFPFNGFDIKDTWDGYQDERGNIIDHIMDKNIKNVVVLTGDIHTTFAADVPSSQWRYALFGNRYSAMVEFVTPSVTSSNFDEFVDLGLIGDFAGFIASGLLDVLNPHLKERNLEDHGYMVIDVNSGRVQADWFYMNDIKTRNNSQRYGQSWYVRNNERYLRKANNAAPSRNLYGAAAPSSPLTKRVSTNTAAGLLVVGNYPNPANTETNLHYALAQDGKVQILIYNNKGKLVKSVLSQSQEAGLYNVTFGVNDLKAGTYIYKVITQGKSVSRRLLIRR